MAPVVALHAVKGVHSTRSTLASLVRFWWEPKSPGPSRITGNHLSGNSCLKIVNGKDDACADIARQQGVIINIFFGNNIIVKAVVDNQEK